MTIVKSRGGMVAMLATLALASVTAFCPGSGRRPGWWSAPWSGRWWRWRGFGGPVTKESTIQRQGLASPDLKLTDAQKASIDKLAEKYAADQTALQAKYPAAQGAGQNPDAQAARTKLREDFTAAVNKVLTPDQQKTWAARPQRGGGMGGGGPGGPPRGPGGGAGGPPPAR